MKYNEMAISKAPKTKAVKGKKKAKKSVKK